MYASGKRKKPPSVMIGPMATPLDAPMLDRISTTAMIASMMPKYGDPIEANRGRSGTGGFWGMVWWPEAGVMAEVRS
ncbi:hypothetical protein NCCP2145_15030 [Pseudarthrobacter sp. NCCP-2145]|nr:hypothetical protein NCCP2145_15030 [Pseudarthrobacter sp. NCCP-2145]